mmetsp:Transcript_47988/g.124616  ORF Transcript_47988/g.124616 Transcript_47988/m.124616 type:complete len:980 (-) Transcript_47988:100-3039(-)
MQVEPLHASRYRGVSILSYRGGLNPTSVAWFDNSTVVCTFDGGEAAIVLVPDESTSSLCQPLSDAVCEDIFKTLFVRKDASLPHTAAESSHSGEGGEEREKERVFNLHGLLCACSGGGAKLVSVVGLDEAGAVLAFFYSDGVVCCAQRDATAPLWHPVGAAIGWKQAGRESVVAAASFQYSKEGGGASMAAGQSKASRVLLLSDTQVGSAITSHLRLFRVGYGGEGVEMRSSARAHFRWRRKGDGGEDKRAKGAKIAHRTLMLLPPSSTSIATVRKRVAVVFVVCVLGSDGPVTLLTLCNDKLVCAYVMEGSYFRQVCTSEVEGGEGEGAVAEYTAAIPTSSLVSVEGEVHIADGEGEGEVETVWMEARTGTAVHVRAKVSGAGHIEWVGEVMHTSGMRGSAFSLAPPPLPRTYLCLRREPRLSLAVREVYPPYSILFKEELPAIASRGPASTMSCQPSRSSPISLLSVDHSLFEVKFDPRKITPLLLRTSKNPRRLISSSASLPLPSCLSLAVGPEGNDVLRHISPSVLADMKVTKRGKNGHWSLLPAANTSHIASATALIRCAQGDDDLPLPALSLLDSEEEMRKRMEESLHSPYPAESRRGVRGTKGNDVGGTSTAGGRVVGREGAVLTRGRSISALVPRLSALLSYDGDDEKSIRAGAIALDIVVEIEQLSAQLEEGEYRDVSDPSVEEEVVGIPDSSLFDYCVKVLLLHRSEAKFFSFISCLCRLIAFYHTSSASAFSYSANAACDEEGVDDDSGEKGRKRGGREGERKVREEEVRSTLLADAFAIIRCSLRQLLLSASSSEGKGETVVGVFVALACIKGMEAAALNDITSGGGMMQLMGYLEGVVGHDAGNDVNEDADESGQEREARREVDARVTAATAFISINAESILTWALGEGSEDVVGRASALVKAVQNGGAGESGAVELRSVERYLKEAEAEVGEAGGICQDEGGEGGQKTPLTIGTLRSLLQNAANE